MRCFLLILYFFKCNVRHITKKIPLWLWVPSMIETELNAWKRLNKIDWIWLHDSKVSIQLRLKRHTHIERVGWHGMHPYWNSKMIALTLTAKQKCTKIITNHKAQFLPLMPSRLRNMHLIPILHNLYLFILSDNPTTCPTQWLCESFLQPFVKLSTGTYSLAYFDLKKIWSHPLLASGSVTSHHQLLFW